ncbi:MAG: Na/Pi cotransporter family protein [Ferrovum sp.]|nr:Na/Pi cotransporter family protein [Ferrovum sp.]
MGITVLLDLTGGVALLLWGLHMVHSGIVRAFGAKIRRILGAVLKNRFQAFMAGLGATVLLQSSTATALMLSSFSASGMVDLMPAMAVMLGANVGTTLIVQLLSFDSSVISPILLVSGVIAFKRSTRTLVRDLGRVAIGLGLMLLSLHILLASLAPAENAPVVRELLNAITDQPLLTLLIGAILTWAAHSSVATMLLTMSLAYSNFITPEAGLALVLGANLGSAMNPVLQSLSSTNPAHHRLPLGNLINRLVGCLLFFPFLATLANTLGTIEPNSIRLVADFHTLFNVVLAGAFILPLNGLARMLELLLPDRRNTLDPSAPLYLDESAIESPSVALACAARETLHMGDIIETMLRQCMTALLTNDRKIVSEVTQQDNVVDRLHEAIKLYVVKVTRGSLDDMEGRRAMEIMALSINLEHIGDIVDKNLMELANKKIKRQLQFSREGAMELEEFHGIIMSNLKLAFSIFLSGDVKSARQLLDEKTRIRELDMTASERHLTRLREGRPESIETSSLHLDVLRDLKRIHSHICATAYPVLEAAGELNPTRLKMTSVQNGGNGDPKMSG